MAGRVRSIVVAALILICGSSRGFAQPAMTLSVDASQARMKILHASLSMPARSGAVTLVYPKWIPGEHMPSGPISNLAGLHIFADGAELPWRRDLVNMNAFHVTVPPGARMMTATYDYVVPTGGGAFGATASANAKCAVINWNTVVLSPEGENPDAIRVTASLKLPAGWKEAGALDVARVDGDTVHFVPQSLTMLVDHPVVLGASTRSRSCSGPPARTSANTSSTSSPTASGPCGFRKPGSTPTNAWFAKSARSSVALATIARITGC